MGYVHGPLGSLNFNLLLLSFFGYFAENSLIVFILISNFFWGFFGKDLYIQKLLSKDYLPRRALNAPTREKALIIYLAEKIKMKLVSIIDYGCGNIKSVFLMHLVQFEIKKICASKLLQEKVK